jgi:aerobic-type carbon monoxide dehydrogenase small subunit (CoxS/CutS family)
MSRTVNVTLNGAPVTWQVEDYHTLLHVLREVAHLYGAREGCGQGVCGACTVLVDEQPASSCIALAALMDGCAITTIEGLAIGDVLDPMQQTFVDHGALQCAYCTPGFVLSAKALLAENPNATEEQIRDYLAGNLCRCTGYVKIIEAVRNLQDRLRADSAASG